MSNDDVSNIKKVIKETISKEIAFDNMFKTHKLNEKNEVITRYKDIIEIGVNSKSDLFPRNRILSIYYLKIYWFDDFNIKRFKLLSSSERLYVTEKVLEEL
jgi:hypothetical protein